MDYLVVIRQRVRAVQLRFNYNLTYISNTCFFCFIVKELNWLMGRECFVNIPTPSKLLIPPHCITACVHVRLPLFHHLAPSISQPQVNIIPYRTKFEQNLSSCSKFLNFNKTLLSCSNFHADKILSKKEKELLVMLGLKYVS